MAIGSTLYRFDIALSDIDRRVYEQLELRVAQHPSETMPFLLTRTLAYCLAYEEGIAFSRGLSSVEEPALRIDDLTGRTRVWIDIGLPSAERLHKASKSVDRVVIYTHKRVDLLKQQCAGERIHRGEEIAIFALEPAFLAALEQKLERKVAWDVSITGGHLFVTMGGMTFSTTIEEHRLFDAAP